MVSNTSEKMKVKCHLRTGHEGPEGEWRFSSALSLTSAQDGGSSSTPHLGHFILGKETWCILYRRLNGPRVGIWHQIDLTSVYFAFRFGQCLWVCEVFIYSLNTRRPSKQFCVGNCESSESVPMLPEARGVFRPRQTRQLPRAVDLKGRLLSCQSY